MVLQHPGHNTLINSTRSFAGRHSRLAVDIYSSRSLFFAVFLKEETRMIVVYSRVQMQYQQLHRCNDKIPFYL